MLFQLSVFLSSVLCSQVLLARLPSRCVLSICVVCTHYFDMMVVRRAIRMRMYIYLLVVCFLSNDIDLIILRRHSRLSSFSHRWHFLLHRQMLIASLHIDDALSVHFFFSFCLLFSFLYSILLHLLRSLLAAARCCASSPWRTLSILFPYILQPFDTTTLLGFCWLSFRYRLRLLYVLYIYFV